jgi:hypothetical protein
VPPHPSHPTRPLDRRTGPETTGAAPLAGPQAPPHPHQGHGTPPETRGAGDTPRLGQASPHAGPGAQRVPRTAKSVANAPPPPQAMGSRTAPWPYTLPRAPEAVCPLGPCGGYRLGARHAAHETPRQWATRSHRPPARWTGAPRAGCAPHHRVAPTRSRGPQAASCPTPTRRARPCGACPRHPGGAARPGGPHAARKRRPPLPPRCRLAMGHASAAGALARAGQEGVSASPTGPLGFCSPGVAPNAGGELRPEAGAQRTL